MKSMAGQDLTYREFAVLQSVAANDGLSQTDIMAATGFERSSTAELVARLVRAGHLRRRRTPRNRRFNTVRMTPQGAQLLALAMPLVADVERRLLEQVPPGERKIFMAVLGSLIKTQ